jgi:hypothetical protein
VNVFGDGTSQLPSLPSGSSYSVALTQPTLPYQNCVVTTGNAAGTVTDTAISIGIDCSIDTATVVAVVKGLIGGTAKSVLTVSDGTDTIKVTADGKVPFPTTLDSGDGYSITITNPVGPDQTCSVISKNASGTVTTNATVTIDIACTWTVGFTVWNNLGCEAFTLTDGTSTVTVPVGAAGAVPAPSQFPYSGPQTFTIDSSRVLNAKTGGLCGCYQSDATETMRLAELPFVNGKDGTNGFVFGTGTSVGNRSAYVYCR